MAPLLEAERLSKSYGPATILRDVTFSIEAGSFAAITGRSGSGKSTLFRLLAGLERPTSGTVKLAGRDLSPLSEDELAELRLRSIGIVFQSFNLLPDLSVVENVRLPMDIAGVPRREATARAFELLDLVHMRGNADRLPRVLSGGEAQRTAIARALANRPSLILADEPTGSLDTANADNVLRSLETINDELGTTILIVTHDPVIVERIPMRLEIRDGRAEWTDAMVLRSHE